MADITPEEIFALHDEIMSVPMRSGYFDKVSGHEPKNAPGLGLTCAMWSAEIRPTPSFSGLNSTSLRFTFNLRLYSSMIQEPQDSIDPNLVVAATMLMGDFTANFDLDEPDVHTDLLGAYGEPLASRAGYLEQDHKMFRVMTLNLPVVRADAFTQAP